MLHWLLLCGADLFHLTERTEDLSVYAQKESIRFMMNESSYNSDECSVLVAWWENPNE